MDNVASGFGFVEGPVWVRSGQYLLFSDIPRNEVMRWSAKEGVRVFLQPSGYTGRPRPKVEGSNGLALDSQGRLVLCEHGDRRISRLNPDGTRTTLIAAFEGKRLNSPNDAVFRSDGDLYFTDPPLGLRLKQKDPEKELSFNGVYRLSRDGRLTVIAKGLTYFQTALHFRPLRRRSTSPSPIRREP